MNSSKSGFLELSGGWREGKDYRIRLRPLPSLTAILAPHGGGIEPGTSEVADALAGDDFSLYCFEGLRAEGNWDLHIPSLHFDEKRCLELVKRSSQVVAVHGCCGEGVAIFVGGLDQALKTGAIAALLRAGFDAREDTTHHSGLDAHTLCNRTLTGRGLQLEISLGLRRAMFAGLKQEERQRTKREFHLFVGAVRQALI